MVCAGSVIRTARVAQVVATSCAVAGDTTQRLLKYSIDVNVNITGAATSSAKLVLRQLKLRAVNKIANNGVVIPVLHCDGLCYLSLLLLSVCGIILIKKNNLRIVHVLDIILFYWTQFFKFVSRIYWCKSLLKEEKPIYGLQSTFGYKKKLFFKVIGSKQRWRILTKMKILA